MGSLRIAYANAEVCKDTISPCIMFTIRMEGVSAGTELLIPVDGRLYSDDGKLLAPVMLEYTASSGAGFVPSIIVDWIKTRSDNLQHNLDIRARAILDPRSLNYIEKRRRTNKYHEVELRLKLRFLRLHSSVHHYNSIYRIDRTFSHNC